MDIFNSFFISKSQTQQKVQIPEGNSLKGKKIYQQHCADCHYLHGDDSEMQAPKLGRLMGRKVGSTAYQSSKALRKANFKWNEENLFQFLRNPQKYIPGNLMVYPGMKSIQDRADLIAFLKRQ